MAVLIDTIASSIQVAASYGNADLLQDGSKSIAELAAATQTHPDSLHRLLRALSSVGFFEEMDTDIAFEERRFAQTPFSQCFCQDIPGSMYAMADSLDRNCSMLLEQACLRVKVGGLETCYSQCLFFA